MKSKLPALAMLLCTFSYAAAETTSIGTATARGNMRVDGYMVKGDTTLFDGTVVETGAASAALRLDKGVEIKLATNSRGTLHGGRLVLQQGSSEWVPSSSFQLEANGLRVTPSEPNSRGRVSVGGPDTVEIVALTGGFQVTNETGLLVARVSPGHAVSFGKLEGAAPEQTSITVTGIITKKDGFFFISVAETGVVYELTGKNFEKLVDSTVTITGTIDPSAKAAQGAAGVIVVSNAKGTPGSQSTGMSTGKKVLIGGLIIGMPIAIGVALYEANESPIPASK